MELKVKEIAKQKGKQLKEIAKEMGITPESLTRTIHGNPQLDTLVKLANALNVEVVELFHRKEEKNNVSGYIEYNNKITKVSSLNDLKDFISQIEK